MTNQELDTERAKVLAEVHARPGPKPLKPIPPEEMAWALDDLPPAEERLREYPELMAAENRLSMEGVLSEIDQMAGDPR